MEPDLSRSFSPLLITLSGIPTHSSSACQSIHSPRIQSPIPRNGQTFPSRDDHGIARTRNHELVAHPGASDLPHIGPIRGPREHLVPRMRYVSFHSHDAALSRSIRPSCTA
jgi:hypothetical protein